MRGKIVKSNKVFIRSLNADFLEKKYNIDKRRKIHSHFLGEMAFETPKFIQKKIKKICNQNIYGYSFLKEDFYKSVINWYKEVKGINIKSKEWIHLNYGTIQAVMSLLQIKFKEKSKIVINTPAYSPFKDIIEDSNMTMIKSNLVLKDNKYLQNFIDLEKKFSSGAKAFILCSPQNPVGRIWDKEELKKILSLTEKYNVLLIVDEVNSDIVINGKKFLSILNFIDENSNVVVFSSANKTFNLGGLKTSYSISPNKGILSDIDLGYKKSRITSPNTFGAEAISTAYNKGLDWLAYINNLVSRNYKIVENKIKDSKILEITKNEGGFFAWISFSKIITWRKEFEQSLIKENIIVQFGDSFVGGPNDFFRFTLANSEKNVIFTIDNIIQIAKNLYIKKVDKL